MIKIALILAFDSWCTATVLGGIIGYSAVSTNTTAAIIGVGALGYGLFVKSYRMPHNNNCLSPITSCSWPWLEHDTTPNQTP